MVWRAFSILGATIGIDKPPATFRPNFSQFIPAILPSLNPFKNAILAAANPTKALQFPIWTLHDLSKVANLKVVYSSVVRRKNTNIVPSELLNSARNKCVDAAKQAITALVHQVYSRTRSSPRSPRTLKELHGAGFKSLNGKICRNLRYKWVFIRRNYKRSRYTERPSWWPRAVTYAPASKLNCLRRCSWNMMLHSLISQRDQRSSLLYILRRIRSCPNSKIL